MTYTVSPFSGKNYHKNASKVGELAPCAICGKPVRNKAHAAVVVDGGGDWGDERSDQNDPGYMGCYPVGPDCHKRFKKP